AAVCGQRRSWGLAAVDASTGEFWATQIDGPQGETGLREEIARLRPAELLLGPGTGDLARWLRAGEGEGPPGGAGEWVDGGTAPVAQPYDPRAFHFDEAYRLLNRHFQTETLHAFGLEER